MVSTIVSAFVGAAVVSHSNNDWCICQKSTLNLQEAVFLVEEVEQEPAKGEVAEAEDELGPRLGEKTHDAAEEEIRH